MPKICCHQFQSANKNKYFWSSRKAWLLTTTLAILFPFSLSSQNKRGRGKGKWIAKIVIKSQAFLLEPTFLLRKFILLYLTKIRNYVNLHIFLTHSFLNGLWKLTLVRYNFRIKWSLTLKVIHGHIRSNYYVLYLTFYQMFFV